MAVHSIADFLHVLGESRLVPDDSFSRIEPRADETTAVKLATRLAKEGLLTRWQAQMLLAGRTAFYLGKYKLLAELGRGGMGAVFQAEQPPLGRIVAIKVMATHLVKDRMAVARFQREIHAAAALEHPNVVTALDADHVQQTHFLVMEYVEGESLQDVLKRETLLPVATACEYVRQAALGLQHAHERGMAHRDIKPSNLLLTRTADGQPLVKILDMGLARFTSEAHDDAALTQTGQVMGTPDYIAPEQAKKTRDADIRSDIFSLGCVLFRMLTGRLPYTGESTMEKLMARALHDAPLVRPFREETPPELEAVVARMLARNPLERYQTPGEVVQALSAFVSAEVGATRVQTAESFRGSTSELRPLDTGVGQFLKDLAHEAAREDTLATGRSSDDTLIRPKLPSMRRRAQRGQWIIALGLGLVSFALLGIGVWYRLGQTRLVIDWPEAERTEAALEVNGRSVSVPSRGALRPIEGRPGKTAVRLSRAGYQDFISTASLRRGETQTLRPKWVPTPRTARTLLLGELTRAVESLADPLAESPESLRIAEEIRQAYPKFVGTSDLPALRSLGRRVRSAADGLSAKDIPAEQRQLAQALASSQLPSGLVALWGDGRWKCPTLSGGTGTLRTDPTGTRVATVSGHGHPILWDRAGAPNLTFDSTYAQAPLAFDAEWTLCALATDAIEVWSVAERRQILRFEVPIPNDHTIRAMQFLPGTMRLALLGSEPQVRVWDYMKNEAAGTFPLPKPESFGSALAVTRDGRLLAAGTSLGEIRIWNMGDGSVQDLPPMETSVVALEFQPGGKSLASGDHRMLRITPLDDPENAITLGPHHFGQHSISWSPDGEYLTSNSGFPSVTVFRVDDPADVRTVTWRGSGNSSVRFLSNESLVLMNSEFELCVMDWRAGKPVAEPGPSYVCGAMDPLGEWVALGNTLNQVELRSLKEGRVLKRFPCQLMPSRMAISPTRQLLAVTYRTGSESLDVIRLDTGEVVHAPTLGGTQSVAFTPDGRMLIAGNGRTVRAWDCRTWKMQFNKELQPPHGYGQLSVSGDGTRVVVARSTGNDGEYSVLLLPQGDVQSQVKTMPLGTVVSPTPAIAMFGAGTALYRLNVTSGGVPEHAYLLPVHGMSWLSLAALPAESQIVGIADDGKLRVVPVERLAVERELDLGGRNLTAVQVLPVPDGRHLVLIMANGTVWVLRTAESE